VLPVRGHDGHLRTSTAGGIAASVLVLFDQSRPTARIASGPLGPDWNQDLDLTGLRDAEQPEAEKATELAYARVPFSPIPA
jgi:hypothetical protein